jgi:hypothetical protein
MNPREEASAGFPLMAPHVTQGGGGYPEPFMNGPFRLGRGPRLLCKPLCNFPSAFAQYPPALRP